MSAKHVILSDMTDEQPKAAIFDDFPTVGSADVAVFWDYENVRIPAWCPATMASDGIRKKIAKYGRVVEKRLYYDSRRPTESSAPRAELDLSGFTLVDCPSRNRKETLDKKLIVDVLCFAWERASRGAKACVVLVTSDGDYSYALARLRDIGVFTVIIYRPDVVAKVLIDNANVVMSWEYDVLGGPPLSHDGVDDLEQDTASGFDKVAGSNMIPSAPDKIVENWVANASLQMSTLLKDKLNVGSGSNHMLATTTDAPDADKSVGLTQSRPCLTQSRLKLVLGAYSRASEREQEERTK
jgi:hypothetical protein